MAVHSMSLLFKTKQDFHFKPQNRLAQYRRRHIKPKQFNRTCFRSGQTRGKISTDYDTHSTFNKPLVHKRGKCPFTGSETDPVP